MARILFVQPSLNPPGGGNVVAAWMIEALKREHAITLLAWRPPDFERINRYAGTALRPSDFEVQLLPSALLRLADRLPTPLWLVRNLYLMRVARGRRGAYDLVVSANNEGDLGEPSVQYVHYPAAPYVRPEEDLRWFSRPAIIRHLYHAGARHLFGWRRERMLRAVTLANSAYIAGIFEAQYGHRPTVCYPPAPGQVSELPWEEREDAFACIGRFHATKRLDQVIDILATVRTTHPQIALHIIGTGDAGDPIATFVRRRASAERGWLHLHEDLERPALLARVARCRFGIHAMPGEHYGMAVAEMVLAGCVPFVHQIGGPAEIVQQPELLFDSPETAVNRIRQVLDDRALQQRLRQRLAARRADLSTDRFLAQVRRAVEEALHSTPDRIRATPSHPRP